MFVSGAQPGDVLAVEILELAPARLGLDGDHPRLRAAGREFPDPWLHISASTRGRRRSTSSTACGSPTSRSRARSASRPDEPGEHSIVPPRRWGGNLDIKHLRAGSTLLLPVGVEGALFSVGDTHAAMGDGEVCGTAVEARDGDRRAAAPAEAALDCTAPQFHVPAGELARTEQGAYHVCTGVGPT